MASPNRRASDNGFDQFGSLFGQVTIKHGDSKEVLEMNLPGVRQSRFLDEKSFSEPPKSWSLVAACKDGFVVSLSAQDIEIQNK